MEAARAVREAASNSAPRLLGVRADAEGVDLDEDGAARAHVPGRVAARQEGVEAAAEAVASRRGGGGRVEQTTSEDNVLLPRTPSWTTPPSTPEPRRPNASPPSARP